jgi:hypothetical protein
MGNVIVTDGMLSNYDPEFNSSINNKSVRYASATTYLISNAVADISFIRAEFWPDANIRPRVTFEVFTAVTMQNGVFWDVTPCGSCKNRRFGGT